MPQTLTVSIYESAGDDNPVVHEGIDFVSLVSDDTYGPPALVAPNKEHPRPLARAGQRVLYINTRHVPMFEIERVED